MHNRTVVIVVIFSLLIGGFGGIFIGRALEQSDSSYKDDLLKSYSSRFLSQSGYSSYNDTGSYSITSFDGGKRWYAYDVAEDDSLIITGTADEIYPGLVAYNQATKELLSYVQEHGPLTLSGENAETEVELLENLGLDLAEQ